MRPLPELGDLQRCRIPYYAGGFEYIATKQGANYTGREVLLSLDWSID